jgi:sodium/hydrogen antiporter
VTVIAVTVLSSVIAHGASAEPPARRYGPLLARAAMHDDPADPPELPTRRLIRRAPAPGTGPAPPDWPG